MTLYSIFEKPQAARRPDVVPVAVPERFSWLAMVAPPLFALSHGLWLLVLFWIVLVMGLAYAAGLIGTDAAVSLYVLVAVFLGFEAPALRRDGLISRGFTFRGDLVAGGEDLALRDYLGRVK
jgi:hypothetical protein